MPIYIQRLAGGAEDTRSPVQRLLGRAVALIAAAGVLAVALMFSLIFFAVALTVAVLVGGRLWWKMRALRKASPNVETRGSAGRVIEGEVLRKED